MFRHPSNNSNGNTFDFEGSPALVRTSHAARRPLRARRQRHRDRRVVQRQEAQFTERRRGAQGRQLLVHRSAVRPQPVRRATRARELPTNVYRVDKSGKVTLASASSRCRTRTVSRSRRTYRKLYVASTARTWRHRAGRKGEVLVFDVNADGTGRERAAVCRFTIDGVKCSPDGVRCDVDGNLWCSSNAGRAVGYSGVTVWAPEGN